MEKHLDKSYIEEISWKNAEEMLIRSRPEAETGTLLY